MTTRRIKYTGDKPTTSRINNGESVEWKKGDVKDVVESKVRNHVKYPYWEEVTDKPKSKSEEKHLKIEKKAKEEEVEIEDEVVEEVEAPPVDKKKKK
ncbi:MAG: hypothetical protein KKD44_27715 [Proteobacteria bacterium]|nr:hypothetical protein [Pseudomonadota bacterium]